MPEPELRPARPTEFDAIAGLLIAAELPVEDPNVTMLDAFIVATVPPSIAATTEFSSLCPDTAECLWRDLTT